MSLPSFKSDDLSFSLLQTKWATLINPVIDNPLVNGQILPSVSLVTGANVINHRLGRKLQGWFLTRVRGAVTIYDTQDSNTMPALTLDLNSSADVVVDIYVF